jgi:RNA polymerase sigma-70 factor (ECF subfamily)
VKIAGPQQPENQADQDLVAAVLRRDRKATAEFVSLHADAVYSYVRRRLIPREDMVEDVVQEVFLAAWEHLGGFRAASSLRSWLLGIARHKVEDYYRSRLREAELLPDAEDDLTVELAQVPCYEEALDRARSEEKTRRVLASLPEPYTMVLLWRYWERRSAREISAQTGKTEKAIERLLARAREQFKKRWDSE